MSKGTFSAEQLARLAAYMEEEDGQRPAIQPGARDAFSGSVPLSFAQQRLWFLDQLQRGSAAYTIPMAYRLIGELDLAALHQSFNELFTRHEVLRTTFATRDGQPIQVIAPASPPPLEIVDLVAVAPAQREQELQRRMAAEARTPFSLVEGPLLRLTLFRPSNTEQVLLCCAHHSILDGWSLHLFAHELSLLYNALVAGQHASLPALAVQYADFACWQREWLQGEVLASELEYWKQRLAGAPPVLELPTDRPRPAVQTFVGEEYTFRLPQELSQRVKALSRQQGCTLFQTLLAAFEVLLYRYTGQGDLVIGTPVANRSQLELEPLLGLFANTLVLRSDLSGQPTFRDLLEQVRAMTVDAYSHQELPFEKLVDELHLQRDLSYTPLVQVLFSLHNLAEADLTLTGLQVSPLPVTTGTTKFDLALEVQESAAGLSGCIQYSVDLFDAQTITRLAGHFQTLLTAFVQTPDAPITTCALLTETEQQQRREWNATQTRYAGSQQLPQLVEAQVERTPEAPAVVFEEVSLSYRELNARANRLAHWLQQQGVGPETMVGICMERSLEMVVGLLGILKAGGTCVPLDPEYPQQRLAFMLRDAQVDLLLTQTNLRERLPAYPGTVVCLDAEAAWLTDWPTSNPTGVLSAEQVAYVIYTSGSTGVPKGVLLRHGSLCNRIHWGQQEYPLTVADRVLQEASFSFDFAIWELFGPLSVGAQVILARPGGQRDIDYLLSLIIQQQITVLHLIPSLLQVFLEQPGVEQCQSVRHVYGGAEPLPWDLWQRFNERMDAHFHNVYGPTEATIDSTCWTGERDKGEQAVSIGRPLGNVQVYVLDQCYQPVPIGVPGEVYIAGAGLARGYLHRAELTAERFLPHPFSSEPGARLYRTGDVARYRANGQLEYVGRVDQQVKVRGFRIELGEIEAALKSHPLIQDAVALVREDVPGEKRLVAYVVPAHEQIVLLGELRAFLQERVPDYMVPTRFLSLERVPLTAQGKLDRTNLPVPDGERPDLEKRYVAPGTPVEEVLAGIWAQVLGLQRVGRHDNFFELGGDSIRSIQIVARAKAAGLHFSVQQLFRHQTIADLAASFQLSVDDTAVIPHTKPFELISLADREKLPVDVEDAYPLSALQAGMIYHMELTMDLPGAPDYHNPESYYYRSPFDLAAFQEAVDSAVKRHPMLRTSFDLTSYSEPLQLVHQTAEFPVEADDIRQYTPGEQEKIIRQFLECEGNTRFDMSRPPLLRFHIHRRTDDSFQFSLTEFHPIIDGWSLHGILAEIFHHYFALLNGSVPVEEEPVTTSYRDFVALERAALQSESCQHYWEHKLADYHRLKLPEWNRPAVRPEDPRYGKIEISMPIEVSDGLHKFAREANLSLKTVLFAAHVKVMNLLSGQTDILTGQLSHGRLEVEGGERVAGLFLNILPLRLTLTGGTWLDLARQAFETECELLPFRRYPLAEMQRRWGGRTPLLNTVCSYFDFHVFNDIFAEGPIEDLGWRVTSNNVGFALNALFFASSSELRTGEIFFYLAYETALISESDAQRVGEYYLAVMKAMIKNPLDHYHTTNVLSTAETTRMLTEWNATQAHYEGSRQLPQLVEAQVERTPEAPAVVFEEVSLSYRELNARANRLAHWLQQQGVGPETMVGICMERSLEMVVGLLGILKAGGTCVPLDPEYPQQRLAFMLRDAQVDLLLTQTHLCERLPAYPGTVVCLDAEAAWLTDWPTSNPTGVLSAEQVAYVIYTSGSTGVPKGVLLRHGSLCNRIHWGQQEYPLTVADRVLQEASFSFDFAIWELFGPLSVGAQVILARPGGQRDIDYLLSLIIQQQITVLHLIPSLLQVFLEQPGVEQCQSVRHVYGGAEPLPWDLWQRFNERMDAHFHNVYGPTEATIDSTCWTGERDKGEQAVSIGRPLGNVQVYVLDQCYQLVPIGVPGEVYIAGAGLARGYLHRAELTAERFLPHPFSSEPGARFYRTGDVARYRADGQLEYVGRVDQQVKVRGFRIELGEIEAALKSHPLIQNAVALVREDVPGEKRLVAYVVASEQVAESEWKAYLSQRLPEYLLPSVFMQLDAFPLNANGKIERRALPVPEQSRSGVEYVAPRTALEVQLTRIWAEVLGLERVGVLDNFFELGGHSLKATQIISRARRTLGIMIPLRSLFEHSTVATLARAFEQAAEQQEEDTGSTLALQPLSYEMHQARLQAYLEGVPDEEFQALLATVVMSNEPESVYSSIFPVSFAQQRIWLLDQITPDTAIYTIPGGLRLIGKLQRQALEQVLNEIVARHAMLRAAFPTVGGRPVQVVQPFAYAPLPYRDLRDLNEAEREEEIQRIVMEDAHRPFNLASGPLFRPSLLQLAEEEHVLLLTVHHIVFDGWSQGVLIQEMVQLYAAFVNNQPSPLVPLPLQYPDYSQWQREWLQGTVMQEQLAFWKQQLNGPLPTLELPTDRPRPPVRTFVGAEYLFTLPLATTKALTALSQQEEVTLFMTLLTALNIVLSRYTGQTDLLIGTPIANRTQSEIENLIGCFINTIVLRTDLSDNPSLRTLLKRVQQMALDAYAHQDLPFEKVVEEVQPERDLSHSPLFQVVFVFQNAPQPPFTLQDLTVNILPTTMQVAEFDFTLYMWETAEGLAGSFKYNTDLFDEVTLARLTTHFQRVLEAMIAHPDHRVSEISLLNAAERAQILAQWNDTQSTFPADTCVQQLIEAQVERTPDAVAVIFEGQPLTYRQLNSRANQLAHLLQAEGVGPETLVGVSMERSLELVVALLAILKAGGAYVPLDPSYPTERLRYLLEDAGVALVLTQSRFTQQLVHEGVKLICLDPDWHVHRQGNEQNPSSTVGPDNMVYMIYTSGSTGQPKGVINIHRALSNRLHWMQQAYQLTEEDRVLQKTPFSFDVSVWEFFWPLISGARLVVARPGGHQDTVYLAELIASEQINTLHFVPSMLQAFLLEPQLVEQCRSLRHVVTSGEALSLDLQTRFFASFPDERVGLHNLYGPTEAAIDVTVWECQREGEQASVPIGYPIANTQIYILDAALQPTPIGVPGELYIGGVGLARGYHRRAALTREKFIADPFGAEEGARLFKTADLARYRADGAIEFLGRIDYQVKIHGIRIELGEIEAALSQHPQVQSVVVLAREDVPGDKRLVAYLVTKEEVAESTWRAYLGQRLPAYMIPSTFMQLDALPLNSNGKVDRRALPIPEQGRSQVEYLAPRTPLEEQLAQIWAQVLDTERVGVLDNFFDLGGHSLKATQIISRIRQIFGVIIPLRSLFEDSTVAAQASVLEELLWQQEDISSVSALQSISSEKHQEQLLTYLEDLPVEELQALLAASDSEFESEDE
ncbi:non-ribosomal peptide synthetase [Ktedonobacteria bacterium brp13]|nr:non-ribosomal peptide synthetase [Ktedonobacteria bacterium brp13]